MQIIGLATATPPSSIAQSEAARAAEPYNCGSDRQRRLLTRVYAQSGIRRRGCVSIPDEAAMASIYPLPANGSDAEGPSVAARMAQYQDHALPLAQRAVAAALDHAGLAAGEVAQLVVVSCTGFASPGVDIRLMQSMGFPADAGRTLIGFMGCHGALNGLRVLRGLASAQPGRPVALCCVELCSLHFRYGWDRDRIVANALFADGAAAVVGLAGDTPQPELALRASGSVIVPDSGDAMTWTIGDHGFQMTLSPRVPDLIQAHLRRWLVRWLASHGLALADVAGWAVHPGGPRVLDAVEEALGLEPGAVDVSRQILAEHGNMSSPTILFILDRVRRQALSGPVVALAFGPGLTVEAALFACA